MRFVYFILESPKKSKFASSLLGSLEKSLKFEDSPTETLSEKKITSKSPQSSFSEAVNTRQKKKKEGTPSAPTIAKNNSEKSITPIGRPSINKVFSISLFKPSTIMSDNEGINRKNEKVIEDALSTLPYRHLIFSPKIESEKFRKYLAMTYKGLLYASNSLRSPSEKFIKSKQIELPDSIISNAYLFYSLAREV